MDIRTDAVPSAPRQQPQTTSGIPERDTLESAQASTSTPQDNINSTREDHHKRSKTKKQSTRPTALTQNINVVNASNTTIIGAVNNIWMDGGPKKRNNTHSTSEAQPHMPEEVISLTQMKKTVSKDDIITVSQYLKIEDLRKFCRVLPINQRFMDDVHENLFESKGEEEVVYQTLMLWQEKHEDDHAFAIFCHKLWQINEENGKKALLKLYEEHTRHTPKAAHS